MCLIYNIIKNKKNNKIRKYFYYIFSIVIFTIIYVALARIGPSIATENYAAVIWIPSGIVITLILLFGYRFWPVITFGEFIVNYYFTPLPPDVSLFMAVGNTAETLLGVYILQYFGFNLSFNHLKDVLLLIVVAISGAAISATFGVTSLYLKGIIPYDSFFITWKTWWVANSLSILIIPPLILTWKNIPVFKFSAKRIVEIVVFIIILIVIDLIVFHNILNPYIDSSSSTYLVFPPLIWAALRFSMIGTTASIFLVTAVSIIETSTGSGPFITKSLAYSLLSLQTYIGTIASTILILAAVETERREQEHRKDEFVSIANHELRTPITSIKAFSQIIYRISSENNFTQIIGHLKKMDRQIDNMTALINGLLNVSRIQIGTLKMKKAIFRIDNLISEIVKDMQDKNAKNKLIIKNSLKYSCDVYADKNYISQVVVNLISNAIKYSRGKSKIIICIKLVKNNYVEVNIKDHGIGLTREEKSKIFEKYFKVSSQNETTISGFGISLFLSKQIIESHNGKLSVVSKKGKGSTFSFTLPVVMKRKTT